MDAPESASESEPTRPRGVRGRCVFALTFGGLGLASVLALVLSFGAGVIVARSATPSQQLLEAAWGAYLAASVGVILSTPLSAIASALVGGRRGKVAALGGAMWLLLFVAQSILSWVAGDSGGSAVLSWMYTAIVVLLMAVVPAAIAAATVLAAVWRWRYGAGEPTGEA